MRVRNEIGAHASRREGKTACCVALIACSLLAGCRVEGHSARAQQLLGELSPITLAQPLHEARQLVPAWIALTQWGRTHLHPDRPDRRRIRHTGCGELVSPQLTCDHCGEVLTGHDLEPIELSDEEAATSARTRR